MLSVTGKGYSKISSQNPFHEDPLPRAFYHPSKKRPLSGSEKKLVLSPIRTESSVQQVQDEAEKNFLAQSHTIRPFSSSPKQTPASPPSDKFDESWPDSERPSSPSFHAGSDNQSAKDEGRTVQAKMQPDAASRYDTASSKHKASQLTANNYPSTLQDYIPEQLFPEKLQPPQVPIEEGSVLQKYIERFRHGTPTSREERMKLQEKKREFWGSSASSNGSTGSLAGKGGESQRRYTGLTSERLQEHDQQDETTEQLQHKAERLLQSAQSLASSEPVVSTDGLGSTGSDISSFSEPAVRPLFLPRQTTGEVHHGLRDFKFGSLGMKRHEDDILYKWRLQHKMEQAKQFPLLPTDETALHKTTPADEEVATRLKEFREKLLKQTTVAAQVVREARVERIVRETVTVMDSAVQTTPQTLRTLSTNEVLKVPMWSFSRKADSSVQTEDPQHVDLKKNTYILQTSEGLKLKHTNMSLQASEEVDPCDSSQQPHAAAESSGAKLSCKGKGTEEDVWIDKSLKQVVPVGGEGEKAQQPENQSGTQYRQFLKAEKPHVYDGGDTPEKKPDRHKNPPNVGGSRKEDATGKSLAFGRVASLSNVLHSNQNGEWTSLPSPSGDFVVQEDKIQQGASRGLQRLKEVSNFPRDLDVCPSQGESVMGGGKGSSCERSRNEYPTDSGDMPDLQQILRRQLENTSKQPVKDTQVLRSTLEDFSSGKRFAPWQSHPDPEDRRGHGPFGEPGAPAQAKLIRQKSETSKVMPSPHFSSSPARTPVTAAIGQVVHDRLFDVSESLVSSVDSSCPLVNSSSHPFQTSQSHQLSLHDAEEYQSDGEFESDPLLQLLRQQRSQCEDQLRYLDSVLSEMNG